MEQNILPFEVTGLDVAVPEGFKLRWQGREIESGPLHVTLDGPGSSGVVDYAEGKVKVDFRVRISLPELAEVLVDIGADPELAAPVRGVIHSEGVVFEDHCFRLSGVAELAPHRLFDEDTKVTILAPSRCKPDNVMMSGPEIRKALRAGQAVSWNFNPTEKRVVLVLPEALGGYRHMLYLAGSYTLTASAMPEIAQRDAAE